LQILGRLFKQPRWYLPVIFYFLPYHRGSRSNRGGMATLNFKNVIAFFLIAVIF